MTGNVFSSRKKILIKLFRLKYYKLLFLNYNDRFRFKKKFREVNTSISDGARFICSWEDRYQCNLENGGTTSYDSHYVFHTSWAARILSTEKPEKHIDIASDFRFVTLVSAFIPIDFYDYRPIKIALSQLQSKTCDITKLPFSDNSIPSLSCMHVVEHIGLERYGDPFDPQGDLKAIKELTRVLKPGGNLLFVVPVGGIARIQYNAHRIYTYKMIKTLFQSLLIDNFALITDNGDFIENSSESQANMQQYGCGCWLFRK